MCVHARTRTTGGTAIDGMRHACHIVILIDVVMHRMHAMGHAAGGTHLDRTAVRRPRVCMCMLFDQCNVRVRAWLK